MELILRLIRSGEISLRNFFRWPPGSFYPSTALEPSFAGGLFPTITEESSTSAEDDKKSEGFLWGVPKKRTSTEKRMQRRIGVSNWGLKTFTPKTNLLICSNCGHHYMAKHLCRNCYDKIMAETKQIRDSVEAKLGDNPEQQNIVVLYENEKNRVDEKVTEGNILVELEKPRPQWFSNNLLQKSTTGPDSKTTTVTVPPTNLG